MFNFRFINFLDRHISLQVLFPILSWTANFFIIRYAVEFFWPSLISPAFDIGLGLVCGFFAVLLLLNTLYVCRVFRPLFKELSTVQI